MILINERNNFLLNHHQNKIKNFIIFLFLLLIITSPSLFLFNNIYNEDKFYRNNNKIGIRGILEEGMKTSLLRNLNNLLMEGFWKDKLNNNGKAFTYFSTNDKIHPYKLNINFRLLYGNSIENWIIIDSTTYSQDIYLEKIDINNIIFNTNCSNLIEKGNIFKKNTFYKLDSLISLNISQKNSSITKINGFIQINEKSDKIIINLNNSSLNPNNHYEIKIKNYTIYLSILLISVFIINQITIKNVKNYTSNAKAISILTLVCNLIWSSYGCFFHFYLILMENKGLKYFCFLGALFFINFTLTDYQFLDIILKENNKHFLNNYEIFKKRIVRFYILSYITLFIMLYFMVDFIFNIYLNLLYTIFTWLPQIIYNCYYYNRTSLPLSYIIINSLFRLFPSLYFFLYKNNFLLLPQKKIMVFINIFLIIFQISFMQIQIYKGPRFFLPKKYDLKEISLYKSKIELINKIKNLPNECSICLEPLLDIILIESQNSKNIQNIDNNNIFKENILKNKEDKSNSKKVAIKEYNKELNINDNNLSILFKNIIIIIGNLFLKSFNFYTISNNVNNKEYIITQCNHVFHSKCLEEWFERKRECPFCRNEIEYLF